MSMESNPDSNLDAMDVIPPGRTFNRAMILRFFLEMIGDSKSTTESLHETRITPLRCALLVSNAVGLEFESSACWCGWDLLSTDAERECPDSLEAIFLMNDLDVCWLRELDACGSEAALVSKDEESELLRGVAGRW
mmetsp:Transcript_7532/g.13616  ORF Transcript_7532/g.13616 Transcript_7532/m.13616 type:complete len:136 (+) Transcript_7532:1611-2018(+)